MPKIAYQGWGIAVFEKTIGDYSQLQEIITDICSKDEDGLVLENAGTLGIGIYRDQALLSHVPANSLPPYLTSLNLGFDRMHPDSEEVIELNYFGESTEFYTKNFIPITQALEAVKIFWETGRLSSAIHWIEV